MRGAADSCSAAAVSSVVSGSVVSSVTDIGIPLSSLAASQLENDVESGAVRSRKWSMCRFQVTP